MSVSRLFKGMGSIWVGEAPRACLPQQAQENLEHIERSLGGATDSTKTTVCVGAGSLRNRVSMANQGMIRKFKTNSTCPQPVFLVLRRVGYINSHDEHVRVLDASTYSEAYSEPPPIHGSFAGWSPVFSRPIKYDWVEKGRSFESSSGNAWCLYRMQADERQQVDTSPRGAYRQRTAEWWDY